MRQFELKKVLFNNIEETSFSNGAMFFYDDGTWDIHLLNVENSSFYNAALRDKQNVIIGIITYSNDEFVGSITVKNIRSSSLGVNLHLLGNGKLVSK